MAQHQVPRNAEDVISKALSETLSTGPFTWEGDRILTANEKEEELQWMASHVLASLLHEGFVVRRST